MPVITKVVRHGQSTISTRQKLKSIQAFLTEQQFLTLSADVNTPEYEFQDVVDNLYTIITTMPKTCELEADDWSDNCELKDNDNNQELIVCLHYFMGASEWFIIEKDKNSKQHQTFGYAILNGDLVNAELGYIDIEELKTLRLSQANNFVRASKSIGQAIGQSINQSMGVELDFHFQPTRLSVVQERLAQRYVHVNANVDTNTVLAELDLNQDNVADNKDNQDKDNQDKDVVNVDVNTKYQDTVNIDELALTPQDKDASNTNELSITQFINDFGSGLLSRVAQQAPPLFTGTYPSNWDKVMNSLKRQSFDAQRAVIVSITSLFFTHKQVAGVINAEMGTGKTMMAIAIAQIAASENMDRCLIVSPPHLVYKWRREILATIPHATGMVTKSNFLLSSDFIAL